MSWTQLLSCCFVLEGWSLTTEIVVLDHLAVVSLGVLPLRYVGHA